MSTSSSEPRLAIILPAYGHSGLMIDAINSVLSQVVSGPILLTIVNDGCKFLQTAIVGRAFSGRRGDVLIEYIHQENGGLSAARNAGINHVLTYHPTVEGVYFLDADNRLSGGSAERMIKLLERSDVKLTVCPEPHWFGGYDVSVLFALIVRKSF